MQIEIVVSCRCCSNVEKQHVYKKERLSRKVDLAYFCKSELELKKLDIFAEV